MNFQSISKKLRTVFGSTVLGAGLLVGGSMDGCEEVAQQFATGFELGQQYDDSSDGYDDDSYGNDYEDTDFDDLFGSI